MPETLGKQLRPALQMAARGDLPRHEPVRVEVRPDRSLTPVDSHLKPNGARNAVNAIVAEGLVKVYKSRKSEVRALDGVDLGVGEGSVLGLLGPDGAGKTTAVRILATLLRPMPGAPQGQALRAAGEASQPSSCRLSIASRCAE